LEIGAVYTTVLAAQHNFEANGFLVKMALRDRGRSGESGGLGHSSTPAIVFRGG
jgi:hypothetical protein